MNVWVDKYDDIRFSINDIYMTLLMTGWMFLFMGLYYRDYPIIMIGFLLVAFNVWSIRTQFLLGEKQYILGMIPHHSMAILMSKKLMAQNKTNIDEFAKNIIKTQEKEIEFMKKL
jgi:hypothetical protein